MIYHGAKYQAGNRQALFVRAAICPLGFFSYIVNYKSVFVNVMDVCVYFFCWVQLFSEWFSMGLWYEFIDKWGCSWRL